MLLDNPTFETAATRYFKLDIFARGTYDVNSKEYSEATAIVLRFLDNCSTLLPGDEDAKDEKIVGHKTHLGLSFGVGDFCTSCGQIHFDVLAPSEECKLKKAGTKMD